MTLMSSLQITSKPAGVGGLTTSLKAELLVSLCDDMMDMAETASPLSES